MKDSQRKAMYANYREKKKLDKSKQDRETDKLYIELTGMNKYDYDKSKGFKDTSGYKERHEKGKQKEDYERIKDLRLKVEVEANATNEEIEELGNLEREYGFDNMKKQGKEMNNERLTT